MASLHKKMVHVRVDRTPTLVANRAWVAAIAVVNPQKALNIQHRMGDRKVRADKNTTVSNNPSILYTFRNVYIKSGRS